LRPAPAARIAAEARRRAPVKDPASRIPDFGTPIASLEAVTL
jgi:hypothetical protein